MNEEIAVEDKDNNDNKVADIWAVETTETNKDYTANLGTRTPTIVIREVEADPIAD